MSSSDLTLLRRFVKPVAVFVVLAAAIIMLFTYGAVNQAPLTKQLTWGPVQQGTVAAVTPTKTSLLITIQQTPDTFLALDTSLACASYYSVGSIILFQVSWSGNAINAIRLVGAPAGCIEN